MTRSNWKDRRFVSQFINGGESEVYMKTSPLNDDLEVLVSRGGSFESSYIDAPDLFEDGELELVDILVK